MFVSRAREDALLAGKNQGLVDALLQRLADAAWLRRRKSALAHLFTARKSLTAILAEGNPLAVTGAGNCRVECLSGRAWVTAEDSGRDFALAPGQRLMLPDSGRIVVSAIKGPARVRLRWA
ncbi:DUF2917 domain-containing protein [Desulfolutivibrio sulfoxidireducens]|uniref:DUF2917 domain-containing protein n=1 Tax=Desulfolutivibrio sulfoxidireducens TaxID=2773299 RepID=UPI00159D1CA6|nr:DUF2917 domain-containing protein [Desulfolutivibrio sulfoxidireducens]QLA17301.1 DUF2917 domain-containing protein [Desulfolutivibrio sulfoxidireducens]QLA20866.1 DUF2917 domain-containing protein [Desulfolutivibrio sulfoxidireducens]